MDLLKDKSQYKLFISQLGNNFCDILKAKQRKDQEDIYSFINTFLYDNYVSQENQNTDEFKKSNNNIDEKQNKNKDNLPNNEEVKVKNSLNYPEKI